MVWNTINELNAIERMRVSFFMNEPISTKVVSKIQMNLKASENTTGLTNSEQINDTKIEVTIPPSGVPDSTSRNTFIGWRFFRSSGDQVLDDVTIQQTYFSFETIDYANWDEFLKRVQEIIFEPLSIAFKTVDCSSIHIEYWDRFIFNGELSSAKPTEILNNLENHLPKESLSGELGWHLHRGWFEKNDEKMLLVNQNTNSQDGMNVKTQSSVRSLAIYTKLEQRELEAIEEVGMLTPVLQKLHDRSIDIFSEILTEHGKKLVKIKC